MLFWYVLKNQGGTTFDYALIVKARDRSRTDNLIITNDVLRQLSYAGNNLNSEIILKFLVFTIINLHKNTPHPQGARELSIPWREGLVSYKKYFDTFSKNSRITIYNFIKSQIVNLKS